MKKPKDCMKVNRRLLPVKLHYFFFMGAIASVIPFRTLFSKQLGLSATEIGVIFCAGPFLRLIANPLFGFLLDYFKKYRLTISAAMIMLAMSHLAMVLVPPKGTNDSLNITEKDYFTKMIFSCQNETLSVWDQKLFIYSEYRTATNSENVRNNFACDIQCSNSTNGTLNWSPGIKFEFRVFVNVSGCDIDIQIEKLEMIVISDKFRNQMPVHVANSSVRQFKPLENCSSEKTPQFLPTGKVLQTISESHQSNRAIKLFEHGNQHVPIAVPEFTDTKKKRYYTIHEIMINISTENVINNNVFITEFDCGAKQCSQQDDSVTKKDQFFSFQFWSLFVLFGISSATFCAVTFMSDTACLEVLQEQSSQFGRQRTFGTIGWGLGCLVAGYLNQIVSADSRDANYTHGFYLLAFLIFLDLVPVYYLKVTDLKNSPNILKDVCFLFTKVDIVYNLITVYVIGVLTGFIFNYEFWLLQEIGASQTLLGLSQTFECIFELPCFAVSGWIISRIRHDHCNSITLLCFGIRYLCFVFMYNPWWSLAAAAFHGPAFGLFVASLTTYAKNKAPPGTEATVQSLMQLSFEGIGSATGSVLGGIGMDKFGCRTSFLHAAELSFLMLFINIIWTIYNLCRNSQN